MLHPITFSFPEEKIIREIPVKTKLISSLIPGNLSTYIYTNETDYYNEYRNSLFALTTKKAGWDCMRHYEIIANGCIPYFPNIEECPPNTMALLPKNLIKEGNLLYDKYKNTTLIELGSRDIEQCKELIIKLVTYLQNNLTTTRIAKYILRLIRSNLDTRKKDVKSILFLSGETSPDYLRCVTLHGFKTIFGSRCHDYPKIPHIYKSSTIDYSILYGKGITYTNLLNSYLRDNSLDETIEEDILNKKYDIVIYGSYHRGMPFYEKISSIYSASDIILLCGEDIHICDYMRWINKGHHVFVREF
jgi:hypothetical protein